MLGNVQSVGRRGVCHDDHRRVRFGEPKVSRLVSVQAADGVCDCLTEQASHLPFVGPLDILDSGVGGPATPRAEVRRRVFEGDMSLLEKRRWS